MRFRLAALSVVACSLALLLSAGQAMAAAEVHRLSLMLSGIPTQIVGGDFNDALDYYNTVRLDPRGYEGLKPLQFTWAFDGELRYFARSNFALTLGVTQMRAAEAKEFLPAITQAINVRAEILSVPVHIGALYYLQAYNQGDFQARAYVGGGLMQYTYSRATFQQRLTNPDSALTANWFAPGHPEYGGSYKIVLTQDAPGYYLETGAHMFFASRYSLVVGAVYRSGQLSGMRVDQVESSGQVISGPGPGPVVKNSKGKPYKMDVGGLGVKITAGIGF
jgi:hypothetical protein